MSFNTVYLCIGYLDFPCCEVSVQVFCSSFSYCVRYGFLIDVLSLLRINPLSVLQVAKRFFYSLMSFYFLHVVFDHFKVDGLFFCSPLELVHFVFKFFPPQDYKDTLLGYYVNLLSLCRVLFCFVFNV